jgi:hypothetical protein
MANSVGGSAYLFGGKTIQFVRHRFDDRRRWIGNPEKELVR